jgi:N-acetylglucosamine-6-sulfatase
MNCSFLRIFSLSFLLLVFLCSLAFDKTKGSTQSPNILLILVDDLRWDALGVVGHPFFNSPNLDRIGYEGVIFHTAFVVHSLCSPSRATILTGLYSHRHGIVDNNTRLNSSFPTIASLLQALGYETAFIGKWHMGYADANPKPGFNRWVSFIGQGQYIDPLLNVDGQDIQTTGHLTDILTDYTLDFLTRDRNAPFLLILSHKAAHTPLMPQDRFKGSYANANVTFPATWGEDLSSKPSFLQYQLMGNWNLKNAVKLYYEVLAGVDDSVGKILAKLEEKHFLDDTLIIFTSDNGLFWGEHNLRDKRLAYEESIRIPLLIRYPKWFAAGGNSNNLVLNLDIAPTLLEAAGINDFGNMQGVSLRELANGGVFRKSFLYEYFWDPDFPNTPGIRAIRTQDFQYNFKYITYIDSDETEELYDLTNDPNEVNNLINHVEYADLLKKLRCELDSLRAVTGDTKADTSVDDDREKIPQGFALFQNYPNPFNAMTTIKYSLPRASRVQLKVFDSHGREVTILVDELQERGFKSINFDAQRYASGLYFCRLITDSFNETKKMVIAK